MPLENKIRVMSYQEEHGGLVKKFEVLSSRKKQGHFLSIEEQISLKMAEQTLANLEINMGPMGLDFDPPSKNRILM